MTKTKTLFISSLILLGLFLSTWFTLCFLGSSICTRNKYDTFTEKIKVYFQTRISYSLINNKVIFSDLIENVIKEGEIDLKTNEIVNKKTLISIDNTKLVNPVYSSDGEKIVFIGYPVGMKDISSNLYISDSDGNNIEKLTINPKNQVIVQAIISKDKKDIYYIKCNDLFFSSGFDSISWVPEYCNLYSYNINNKSEKKLLDYSILGNYQYSRTPLSLSFDDKFIFLKNGFLDLEKNHFNKYNFNNEFIVDVIPSLTENKLAIIGRINKFIIDKNRFDDQLFRVDNITGEINQITDLPTEIDFSEQGEFISPTQLIIYKYINPEDEYGIEKEPVITKVLDFETITLEGKYSYDGGVLQKIYLDINKINNNEYNFSGTEAGLSPLNDKEERYQIEETITGKIILTNNNNGKFTINEYKCNIDVNIKIDDENNTYIVMKNNKNDSSSCDDWYNNIELLKTN